MKKKKSLVDIENDHSRSFMLGGHRFAIITFSIKSFSSFSILTNLIFLQLLLFHASLLLSLLIPSSLLFQPTCKCDFFLLNFICIYSAYHRSLKFLQLHPAYYHIHFQNTVIHFNHYMVSYMFILINL